ncbi:hypothetical protein BH23GEM11_BH23GEM11_01520 [soil metagenome]
MAELHVERKESNPWPWIIAGIVILALVLWFFLWRGDDPAGTAGMPGDTTTYTTTPAVDDTAAVRSPAVQSFVQFADEGTEVPDTGTSHDYTSTGLDRLVAALEDLANRDAASSVDGQARLTEMRAFADSLQRNPESTEHSRYARDAFLAGARVMEQMQQGGMNLPADAVADVRTTATEMRPGGLLLDQIPTVRRYFERSATALRSFAPM